MRPRIELFSKEQVERIVGDALRTLETVGVFVETSEARTLLAEAGVRVERERAFIGEDAVRRALATAPSSIVLHDRDGRRAATLEGDEVHFDPGSAAIHVLDAETGRRREPTTEDCVRLAWVTEACRHVALQSTGLVPSDVPATIADRFRLFVALQNSRKPVVTGTFLKDGFAPMKEMLVAVRGSEEDLRARPLAIFDCAPTPPLKWSDLTCQALVDCARSGIPAQLVSMPMAGATAPVTLREVVVQHTAENLSGVVIHQLAQPGAPIIYGGSPSVLDMRHGTTRMGAIETMMVDAAYAGVGKHLGLPTHAYMALSDAKTADWQAGAESSVGAVVAALAGVNVVSGPGMLDFESCQSPEKLLLDDEACGMALRLVAGIEERAGESAEALLAAVVEAGHFLGHPHTRAHFRREILVPGKVVDRATYGEWEKAGARSAFRAAVGEVKAIVGRGNPAPPSDDLRRSLREVMAAEARRAGVDPGALLG